MTLPTYCFIEQKTFSQIRASNNLPLVKWRKISFDYETIDKSIYFSCMNSNRNSLLELLKRTCIQVCPQIRAQGQQFAPHKMAPDPIRQPAIYFSCMNSNRNSTRIFEEKTYLYTSLSSNKSRQQFPPRKMAPDPV